MNPRIVIDGWINGYIHGHISDLPHIGFGALSQEELETGLERAMAWEKKIEEYQATKSNT